MPATELLYHGRAMIAEPANMPLARAAALLCNGRTVYLQLEPGDATRYELLITPLRGVARDRNGGTGIPSWGPEAQFFVTVLVGGVPRGTIVWMPNLDEETYDIIARGYGWSRMVLAWFLEELYAAAIEESHSWTNPAVVAV